MTPFDLPPSAVRAHFAPHADGLTWRAAPAGFSGARVWCGESAGAPRVALKAWQPGADPDRLRQIHAWVARAAHLPFIPEVLPGAGGTTAVAADGRLWDCSRWMPGAPRRHPTAAELAAACTAVARLHRAWAADAGRGPCPGVLNRLRILAETEPLVRGGPAALPAVNPRLDPLLRRAVAAAARLAPAAARALEPWARRPLALRPCVRDLRGEHVLYDGGRVTGLVDFGAAAVDHPAVDLARFLGDAAEEGASAAALGAYRAAGGADVADDFVRLLAHTGNVCAALGWVVRVVVRREPAGPADAVAARLAGVLDRLDRIARI